jgi:hypothetical protein
MTSTCVNRLQASDWFAASLSCLGALSKLFPAPAVGVSAVRSVHSAMASG